MYTQLTTKQTKLKTASGLAAQARSDLQSAHRATTTGQSPSQQLSEIHARLPRPAAEQKVKDVVSAQIATMLNQL